MELFSLMAKLTLDADDFTSELEKAERAVDAFQVEEPDPLTLDTSEFDDNLEHSQELGSGFEQAMSTSFGNVASALKTAGIGLSLAAIVGQMKEMINMTVETADEIDKGASRLGISRKTYQEWDHALRQSGASINDLKKGLMNMQLAFQAADPKNFNDEIGDAEDHVDGLADKSVGLSQDAYDALRQLDMLGDLAGGKFASAEEIMDAALLKLAAFEGTKEDRGVLVRKLFGRGGDVLNDMLDEGYAGVKALMDEADRMGLIMTDEEIDSAVAYGDAVQNLKDEIKAIEQAFVATIIPALTDAVTWLTDFLEKLNPRLQTSSVYSVIDQINTKTLAASANVDSATVTAKKLIEDLQAMGDYWSLDEQGRMTWDALAAKALDLFPQLSTYIDTDGKKIQGNTKDIEDNIDAWARLEKQRLLSAAMAEKEEAVAKQLTAAYEKSAEAKEKEADAYAAFSNAVDQANKYIKENPNSPLVTGLKLKYGDDFKKISADSADALDQLKMLGGVEGIDFGSYTKATEEAKALREESEKMVEEAEKARDDLKDQQTYLEEAMGLTKDGIDKTTNSVKELAKAIKEVPTSIPISLPFAGSIAMPRAIGDSYIPYDNFPALLHRGERILTATENRNYNNGADFSGLEDRIERAIRRGMDGAQVHSYLNGKDITDEVNRNNINAVKGRRFSG